MVKRKMAAPKDRHRVSFEERITQLYEQGADTHHIVQYVRRFAGCVTQLSSQALLTIIWERNTSLAEQLIIAYAVGLGQLRCR